MLYNNFHTLWPLRDNLALVNFFTVYGLLLIIFLIIINEGKNTKKKKKKKKKKKFFKFLKKFI